MVRYTQKAKGGVEDLYFGSGTVIQTRNNTETEITKINSSIIPYSGNYGEEGFISVKDILDMKLLNRVTYDFNQDGGAVGDIILASLPINAVVTKAWFEVVELFTSAGLATVAFGIELDSPTGLKPATAFDSFALGFTDTVSEGSAANYQPKTTDIRNLVMTVADAALTGGKLNFWYEYIVSA